MKEMALGSVTDRILCCGNEKAQWHYRGGCGTHPKCPIELDNFSESAVPFNVTRTWSSTIEFPFFAKKKRRSFGSGKMAKDIPYGDCMERTPCKKEEIESKQKEEQFVKQSGQHSSWRRVSYVRSKSGFDHRLAPGANK
jgi:hypothetical protein